ncbi:hypothetical protein [Planotetraspora phitsanulokensis]|uniref:hypothetical protein n=1 Tax=Planotetraspora phitsanulokensis TaxID=575192 RepID=UPI001952869D|nr:hypothetical protein [Planotetraspora phitsanulokensis]
MRAAPPEPWMSDAGRERITEGSPPAFGGGRLTQEEFEQPRGAAVDMWVISAKTRHAAAEHGR